MVGPDRAKAVGWLSPGWSSRAGKSSRSAKSGRLGRVSVGWLDRVLWRSAVQSGLTGWRWAGLHMERVGEVGTSQWSWARTDVCATHRLRTWAGRRRICRVGSTVSRSRVGFRAGWVDQGSGWKAGGTDGLRNNTPCTRPEERRIFDL